MEVDKGQIRQVISNLVVNAKQAMWEGGMIEVRAENISLDAAHAVPLKSNRCVKVSIRDHGVGIPPENLHKIFDPYFTTRVNGSGLGLATAYSVIKNHGGHITADSELGAGTTFYFYLPVADRDIPVSQKEEKKQPVAKGRVLVMDDEEMLRDLTSRCLTRLGYKVTTARNGQEVIRLFKQSMDSRPYDAVIMDLTVPGGLGGKETIVELRKIDPNVKAIIASGYLDDPVLNDYKKYGFSAVIRKPFHINELYKTLNKIL